MDGLLQFNSVYFFQLALFSADGQFISPQIQEIFERVRDGADYMPARQCEVVSVLMDYCNTFDHNYMIGTPDDDLSG